MYSAWCTPKWARKQTDSSRSVKILLMVSTCAFGTGIDAPNVRLVLHVGGLASLKDYAQEAVRAGRDGQQGRCIVIYSQSLADSFQHQLEVIDDETRSLESHNHLIEWLEMRNWLKNTTLCRTNWLYSKVDGISPGITKVSDKLKTHQNHIHFYVSIGRVLSHWHAVVRTAVARGADALEKNVSVQFVVLVRC
ncbi:ATP-dependent DNA helicase RecQ [Gracilaria domingensis]|nr:ATP-dependent DNA helicase RecQ [Gracilaria domingensis]